MPLIVFFAIALSYQAAKLWIYSIFPDNDIFEYMIRDTWMDIPRLIAGSLALWYAWNKYGKERLGLNDRGGLSALLVLGALLLAAMIDGFNPQPPPLPVFLVLGISSFIVGFHEEVMFRGLGFEAMKDKLGETRAFFLSTFLFTIFHYKAQPYISWPGIFMIGLLFARMRVEGVSLPCLIFLHGAYDALIFLFDSPFPGLSAIYQPFLIMLVYAVYTGTASDGGRKFGR